ncbi:hypothetical protein CR513_13887, partial [Mucuna pruriens]
MSDSSVGKTDETVEAITSILEKDDPCLKGTKPLGPKRKLITSQGQKNHGSPHPLGAEEPWNCLWSESESSLARLVESCPLYSTSMGWCIELQQHSTPRPTLPISKARVVSQKG